ncbi:hypothetical protein [Streptomyces koyangensis]|uniref:hypothetical protein n=1 Tax=Streptomyces koyangensis TaxID=188770 RepID=UPI001CED85F9|nr:hypothetical protein [Streptomyces koyangensis]
MTSRTRATWSSTRRTSSTRYRHTPGRCGSSAAGLSSRTIHDLLPCALDGQATPELLHRRTEQRKTLTTLTTTRDTLDQVIANAEANLRTGKACGGGE